MSAKQLLLHSDAHAKILAGMGMLDACKVTRTALQNAASIAGLVLTTDCMIAKLPVSYSAAPGMGNMDM